MYFLLFRIFEQLALAPKNRVALKMFTVFKYFLSFRIFEKLVLALKTEFALKFFKPGGATAPFVPRLVRLRSGPPELLYSEISFSRTRNFPKQWKSTQTRSYENEMCILFLF